MKCLLIETKDKRKFFTHEKNFLQLIEFSKTFNAEISVVRLDQAPILDLEQLAPAICDPDYKKNIIKYEVIETKLGSTNRPNILKIANKINNFIVEQFGKKTTVSLKELKKKFKQCGLSDAALCNHIRRAKKQLESQGLEFVKLGAGIYKAK
jgi:hypothetical protein